MSVQRLCDSISNGPKNNCAFTTNTLADKKEYTIFILLHKIKVGKLKFINVLTFI